MKPDAARGQLEPLLLAVLADGPRHGYAIIDALRLRSGGRFTMPEGTVYPALHRLEAAGAVVSEWLPGARQRRVYHLTGAGQAALAAARSEWRQFALAMGSVLGATI